MKPLKSTDNEARRAYRPSYDTDIRRSFARERKRLEAERKAVIAAALAEEKRRWADNVLGPAHSAQAPVGTELKK